jgi:LDH2 family malate/lactate/ureidoglycolate dehydrogenase
MGGLPVDAAEAHERVRALGLSEADARVVFDHLDDAERRGKHTHGYARIPWLEAQVLDPSARPIHLGMVDGVDRWDGAGALGYVVLAAACGRIVSGTPAGPRLVVAERCFPTGVLGYWARKMAEAGYVAVVTATSPRRLPHPGGGPPLTGTNPLAIAVPSSEGPPIVVDVSMGAVTHGDVLTGRALPEELVPFGGPHAHKAFALAVGLELLVGAFAGDGPAAVMLVARPEHDPVPGFRALAAGLRLPGDS